MMSQVSHISNKIEQPQQRVFSGTSKARHSRHKHGPGSLSIGPQPHINRLKRFYCDNLDKQNQELADKIQLKPNNFSQHLKSLMSDRLRSAKGAHAPAVNHANLEAAK